MKVIQDREVERLCQMIRADDREMRDLAIKIIKKKEVFRFSFTTILVFHCLLFIASITFAIKLGYMYNLRLYLIPVITFCLFLSVFSIIYLANIAKFRSKYNSEIKDLKSQQ